MVSLLTARGAKIQQNSSTATSNTRQLQFKFSILLNVILLGLSLHLWDLASKQDPQSPATTEEKATIERLEEEATTTEEISALDMTTNSTDDTNKWPQHKNKVYGHVHMAKTAGTEINGEFATRFERVCGHKGYSYDYYSYNAKADKWKRSHPDEPFSGGKIPADSMSRISKGYSRGRVPPNVMNEIGYHDCDWISNEMPFSFWGTVSRDLAPADPKVTLEIHVPCREPIDYLMSMCNYRGLKIACNVTEAEVFQQADKCIFEMNRFSDSGRFTIPTTLKCFNPIPIEPYIEYMGRRLQPKRFVNPYIHRTNNKPRNKDQECLYHEDALKEKVKAHLASKYPIFRFCQECTGSKDELQLG